MVLCLSLLRVKRVAQTVAKQIESEDSSDQVGTSPPCELQMGHCEMPHSQVLERSL